MKLSLFAISGAIVLSACSGGGGSGAEFGAITQARGGGHTVEIVDDDTRLVRSGVQTSSGRFSRRDSTVTRRFDRVADGFQTFGGNPDGMMVFEALGDTGGVRVTAHVNDQATIPFGVEAEGLSAGGTTPTRGTADYAGKYVGFLARAPNNSQPGLVQSYITGDVTMTADFGRDEVSGEIFNRTRRATSNGRIAGTAQDVTLAPHSISNGQSVGSGTLAGGGLNDTDYIFQPQSGTLGGQWSVAFGGDGAPEVGGLVEIDHNYVNGVGYVRGAPVPDDYVETGGFAATKQ